MERTAAVVVHAAATRAALEQIAPAACLTVLSALPAPAPVVSLTSDALCTKELTTRP